MTMHGYKIQTSVECTIVLTAELMIMNGLGSSLD
jgi:hypothetical protein